MLLQLLLVVMLVAGVALVALGLSPSSAKSQQQEAHLHMQQADGSSSWMNTVQLAPGPPRYVLVIDCGSSGTRM